MQYLRKVIPGDRAFLQIYDPGFGAMRTIAMATASGGHTLDLLTPLSEEARTSIGRTAESSPQDVIIFDQPEKMAISREMLRFHGVTATSLMVLLLASEGKSVGNLVVISEGSKTHNPEHARLLALLKEPFIVAMSNALRHREVLKLQDLLADDNRYLQRELLGKSGEDIIGANFGLAAIMEMVREVAPLDSPVLLLGETGTGKDVIANAIHYSSSRRDGPFIKVNCGAIPDTLIDSELFGHEKGAFTGAVSQKRGRFERADKGTIFLDEVAELPLQAQVKLLRVLHNREIERVGGTKLITLDIRIITATNRDLEGLVKRGDFREDLWFRLNVFPIVIPPLRERKSDLPALVQHFIGLKARELKLGAVPELAPGAIHTLMEYDWPGNVRELQNLVERALILHRDGPLSFEGLTSSMRRDVSESESQLSDSDNLAEMTTRHISRVLKKANGRIHGPGGAADLLGINPSTLRNRMKKLGIEYGRNLKK
jgi:transcriptional regulator with GAF, ATPase, and Fis domain